MSDIKKIYDSLVVAKRKLEMSRTEDFGPQRGASAADVADVERGLGLKLDVQYREFLLLANGWKRFGHSADLFGTDDLRGTTDLMKLAQANLQAFNPDGFFPFDEPGYPAWMPTSPPLHEIANADLIPIGFSSSFLCVLLIGKAGSSCAGQVLEILGSAVNRYPDFESLCREMLRSAENELQRG